MIYTRTIQLVALAACATISSAAPTTSSAAPASTPHNKSPNDAIYQHLVANNKLSWKEKNGGYAATIQKGDWQDAKKATGTPDRIPTRDLEPRDNGGGQEGQIENLSTNVFCYGTGAVAQDSQIQSYTVTACDALLGMALPKPAANLLQVWQSADFADANGDMGYLRYSFEILNAITNEPDQSICEQAMDMYLDFCQSSFGNTQGGENYVGSVYKFSVDPTGDAANS